MVERASQRDGAVLRILALFGVVPTPHIVTTISDLVCSEIYYRHTIFSGEVVTRLYGRRVHTT